MKLYLALESSATLMEGTYENLIGIYSTPELAAAAFYGHCFDGAERVGDFRWVNHVDGELTVYYEVEVLELDKPRFER